ncbi:MAG TPA: hypothetical protein VH740_23780 [Vicinamibacterales bacterium]|jgi:hypothetical protein
MSERDSHDVISAFLDDEPFDPRELSDALSDPAGRALLIDLIALRHIVQPIDVMRESAHPAGVWRRSIRPLMAAAAIVFALAGGYLLGQRRTASSEIAAPAPTRVVQGPPAWQSVPEGSRQ